MKRLVTLALAFFCAFGPIDNAAAQCASCFDFSTLTLSGFDTQDADSDFTILNDGASIQLNNNTWRQTEETYTITTNTVLEFTFESTSEGEVHGIGFDEDNSLSADRIFKVHGTQAWGIRDFDTYTAPGSQQYVIPVGQYYTGSGFHLVLANDQDAGTGASGTFTNVRIYEQGQALPVIDDPGNQTSYVGWNVELQVTATDANGDPLTFSATGLPDGLSIAPDGLISGIPTTLGTWTSVVITVDDGISGSDTTSFTWTISESSVCADCLDFSTLTLTGFDTQDADSDFTILNGGASLQMNNNTWRQTEATYTITPDTVLEFTFESTSEGEVHGIGFDEDNSLSADRIFKVHGTQAWGIADFDTYTGPGPEQFVIAVGQYYTGTGMHLVLSNDQDAGTGANGTFTHVRIYEDVIENAAPVASFAASPDSGEPPLLVNFDASASSDPDGIIEQFEWDFDGDGNFDEVTTQANASYTYSVSGNFTPAMRVTDNLGATATTSVPITVTGTADLRPNMRAADAFQVQLTSDGSRLLLSTMTYNVGDGPLEIIGGSTGSGVQNVYQRIYRTDGSSYDRLAGQFVWHDEHNHVHFSNYATYTLQPHDAAGGSAREGHKTTFCLMDTDLVDGSLPNSPSGARYTVCGAEVQGISVGWGDTYPYYLADQDIDVTGLDSGDYSLTIEVDPNNRLLETNETDNISMIYVRLDFANNTATVIDQPGAPNEPPPDPVTITSITPDSGPKNSVVPVVITGSGFVSGMPVYFENGEGKQPEIRNMSVSADGQTITADVVIGKGGRKQPSTWDLRVGIGRLANAFTVQP